MPIFSLILQLLTPITLKLHRNGDDKKETVKNDEALKGKLVGLYFSSLNCAPCKQFTSLGLKPFYEAVTEGNLKFEIIYVPCGHDNEADVNKYLKMQGSWLYVPFGTQSKNLVKKYKIWHFPQFLVMTPEGKSIGKGKDKIMEAVRKSNGKPMEERIKAAKLVIDGWKEKSAKKTVEEEVESGIDES